MPGYKHGYAALERAVEMRELLASVELTVDSVEAGANRYMASWWRIDMAYRLCRMHLREYGTVEFDEAGYGMAGEDLREQLPASAGRPLGRSSAAASGLAMRCAAGTEEFFDIYVRPFLDRGQKVFVIVSDGLRYEAAEDFAQRLRSANRWTADVGAVLGQLPSYTQLGMASLLPGKQLSVDPATVMRAWMGEALPARRTARRFFAYLAANVPPRYRPMIFWN